MNTTAKNLHSLGQVCRMRQCNQRLLLAQVLDILQGNGLSFAPLLCELVEGCYILLFRVCETDDQEEICVQVAVVEGTDCVAGAGVFAKQDNVGRARLDE